MEKHSQHLILSYAAAIIRWRWLVIAVTVMAVATAALGVRNLAFTTDYRVFFSKSDPQLEAYEKIQAIYTRIDDILFVIKPARGDIFTPGTLAIVEELTAAVWKLPFVTRVDSVTNFQHTEAEGDDLTVGDLVTDAAALTAGGLARVRRVALSEPALAGNLVATDGGAAGVYATLHLPEGDPDAVALATTRAEDLARAVEARHPGLRIAITGVTPLSAAFPRASIADLRFLTPLMYGIIVIALIIFLRSATGTIATVLVVGMATTTAMGLAGWAGLAMTPPAGMAPTIILTIAVADCVHILVTAFNEMRKGASRTDALIESLRVNMQPVFLTSLTTGIGFLSLNFSDSPPFHDLGNIAATGVAAAWVLAITLLPALMAVLPVRIRPAAAEGPAPTDGSAAMARFGAVVVARRVPLFWGMAALIVAMSLFIPRIEINDTFVEYFDSSITFRTDSDFAAEHLTGTYRMEFSVGSGDAGGIADPDYLERLDAFARWLRAQPGIAHVNTFSDVMKRLNKSLHGDDQAWYRLPDDRQLAAQYLLLYEMSLPYGLDLNSQLNVDKSATRLTVTMDPINSSEMHDLKTRAEAWLADNGPPSMASQGSGAAIMFVYITRRNIETMLFGTFLAFLLIAGVLVLALRSFKLGVISLIPNVVPVAMGFGVWALVVGELGLASSVVAATSLGLIVDDTVHFLSKYLRGRRERGLAPEDAVLHAFTTVGRALWVTTMVLATGFAVLAFSAFKVNANMGLLTAITILIALAIDFLFLPALLIMLDRGTETDTDKGGRETATQLVGKI